MTSQVDLDMDFEHKLPQGKVCSREDIRKLVKKIDSSRQVSLNGWMFCKFYSDEQVDWIIDAITDTLNNHNGSYFALLELKESLKGGKIESLRSKYAVPKILKYSSTMNVNSIYDANNGKCFIPVTASEILDLILDIKKGRSLAYIFGSYNFHHKDMNREYLERFINAYTHKELNKLIKFICTKSNQEGGFVDHGVDVIRNRRVEDYLL